MKKLLFTSIFVLAFCFVAFGQDLPCPIINLTGPASLPEPNGIGNFLVIVSKDSKDPLNLYKGEKELEYFWTVKNGKIISGQGTVNINVQFNSDLSLTATVKVKGLPENCPNTVLAAAFFDPVPKAKVIDEFPTSAPQLDKSKLNNLIISLKDDLTATAYIIIYADEKTSPKKLKQKEQQIKEYLLDKNHQANRIVIVNGGKGKDLIRLLIVPQGAEPPTP